MHMYTLHTYRTGLTLVIELGSAEGKAYAMLSTHILPKSGRCRSFSVVGFIG